jgi:menaquinone-specific isochorismate synthase
MSRFAHATNRTPSGHELLVAALAEARLRAPGTISIVTLPAPLVEVERLWEAFPEQPAALWDPPGAEAHAGVGEAARLIASGRDRFASLREQLERLWARVHVDHGNAAPRALGGFSFSAGAADRAPWSGYGDAAWALPRWSYRRDGERAWLELAVDTAEAGDSGRCLGELDRVEASLGGTRRARPDTRARTARIDELDPEVWRQHVETIRRAIFARRCEKIVAARCSHAVLDAPRSPETVLARLAERYTDCYRFGFRQAGGSFVGATPERLIAKHGDEVTTEALAGSIATDSGDAAALLASAKDRGEQELVVAAVREALMPWCAELDVPAEPRIRALRHVLHLETPIRGRLAADRAAHVLDLVAALHPTPAVGGVPTRAALSWIEEFETTPRGWYASPVGWVDARGDGDLAVAIRSALLSGNAAFVYAGAGIVRESDPEAEYEETRVKQRAILEALGVDR